MTTETQTAGTNAPDTSAPAPVPAPSTLLTDAPAAPATDAPAAPVTPPAEGTPPATEAQNAPVEYAEFTAPEGTTLDVEAITELKALAAEKKLSQEDAQKLVDLGTKTMQRQNQALISQLEQVRAQWTEASHTDKEFGGDKLSANVAVAKQALDTFGTPELSKMLKESGLGNHPEIIRAFYRVGKAISEDKIARGTTRPAGEDNSARSFYPNSTMN